MSAAIEQRNQDATTYVGNLADPMTEELLWELMLQAGPVVNVHMPKDKVTGIHQGYGFVEFRSEEDAEYAIKIMNMIPVYGKPVRVNKASQDKKTLDVGANLFIGNLDPEVDEKLLYDTFSAFGGIIQPPKIMRDPDTGMSKGYGFVSFDSFEASDLAIECMSNQFLCNRRIVVQYAFKKDSNGERHGSQAERLLAANNPNKLKPHTMFAAAPGQAPMPLPPRPPMIGSLPPPPVPAPPVMGMGGLGMGMGPPPQAVPPPPPRPPIYGLNPGHAPPPPPPVAVPPPPPMSRQGLLGMPPPPPSGHPGNPRLAAPPPPPSILGMAPPPPPIPAWSQ